MLIKSGGQLIKTVQTDNNGLIRVVIPEGKLYNVEVAAAGYVPQNQTIDFTNVPRGVKKEIVLDPIVKIAKGLVFKFKNVNFNTGTAELTPESLETLDKVAVILVENPKLQIEVSGHTDNQGNPAANLRLSSYRANAVMKYLISKGAKPEQLKALGFGQTKWIASNITPEGRAENRRVEFKVLGM
jgi:outer membrane protein OmpA-like peptidoglycan-associated protein